MEQYWGVKTAHPDKVLFFRMGDFFEIFAEDAELAAPILGIALTYRNKKSGDDTKMCGMPHHSIAGAVNKLLNEGYKVAICDQLEDPKEAKGLVKRGITRILSPGMVFDPETLEASRSNYIACFDGKDLGFLESSTGEIFFYESLKKTEADRLLELLNPSEQIVTTEQKEELLSKRKSLSGPHLSLLKEEEKQVQDLSVYKKRHGIKTLNSVVSTLLSYASMMQGEELLTSLRKPEKRTFQAFMRLSPTCIRHLEIFEDARGEQKNSLFHKIKRTKTSTGARLLKRWMAFPLMNTEAIEERLSLVEAWMASQYTDQPKMGIELQELREKLSLMGDPERRLAKVSGPSCSPKDMQTLKDSLAAGMHISALVKGVRFPVEAIATVDEIIKKVEHIIIEDAPVALTKGSYINKGVHETLDEYFELTENAQGLLKKMEEEQKEALGIPSLKIRYNNVFGYYIEVTKTHSAKVPDSYQRKQTLTNSERYTTEELKVLERKILSAKSKREDLELSLFKDLKQQIMDSSNAIYQLVDHWSEIDVLSSFAYLANERSYVRPQFVEGSLNLKGSAHPVLEMEIGEAFVRNDIEIAKENSLLITGPNMAGKSTIMRQVATSAILAQMGCFVPAKQAELPVFDQVFTRIGASDALSEGMSTFMVEMTETAEILEKASSSSLILLDEIGRGTSTYDGMSLAQAILEYLLSESKSYVLFSTHYHELTSLAYDFPNLKNYHMKIGEEGSEIRFKHKFVEGAANRSYGVHVAKLAGLPKSVTKRAEKLLKEMELQNNGQLSLMAFSQEPAPDKDVSQDLSEHPLVEELRSLPITEMTPIEIMSRIAEWQSKLS